MKRPIETTLTVFDPKELDPYLNHLEAEIERCVDALTLVHDYVSELILKDKLPPEFHGLKEMRAVLEDYRGER